MKEIILVGNPNTGKTTLYNTITNSNEKAANWHGVTVGVKSKMCKIGGEDYLVTDVPGMYSFSGLSKEEEIASKYILEHKEAIIVNVCDVSNFKRNMNLLFEFESRNIKTIIAINMINELSKEEYDLVKPVFNKDVVAIDARNNKGVESLLEAIVAEKTQKISKNNKIKVNIKHLERFFAKIINNKYVKTDKIDKLILNKFLFLPIFFTVVFLIFYLTFGGFGELFSGVFSVFFGKIVEILQDLIFSLNIIKPIKMFLCFGVLESVLSLISFIPQIVLLMFFINLLEDIGFMSRVAFMFDGCLKRMGLSGKSLFSLMMGFGCTTSAVITTRNLNNKNVRKRTALLLPFMSCSAKLPIFLVVASLFFERYKVLIIFLLYIFAVLISLLFAVIYKKCIPDNNDYFILEMPKYRFPCIKKILKDTLSVIADFLIKVGSIVVIFSSVFWVLQNFSFNLTYLESGEFNKSILYSLSNFVSPVFKFIGLENVGVVAALLFGIVAKELVVVGLSLINGVSGGVDILKLSLLSTSSVCYFTLESSLVFLIFILLYSPCFSALVSVKNEFGLKTSLYVSISQFLIAYGVSFLVYKILNNSLFIIFLLIIIVLAFIIKSVLKLINKKRGCVNNCDACRKICCG